MEELQSSIVEKETTGQLFAVSPSLEASATAGGEGDGPSTSQHDAPASEDGEEATGQCMVTKCHVAMGNQSVYGH